MMYYWTVKHDDSDAQDIISYREEFGTLRQHHIIIESLSPLLKNSASFALGHRIYTDKTWRDLNDTLVIYLQSQSVQDDKEKPALGINIGTIMAFRSPPVQNSKATFSKSRGGIF